MLRKFEFNIPFSRQDSFELLLKSGRDVRNWQTKRADVENGYIEWKQHFWTLSGSAAIAARLEQTGKNRTSVEISVIKPFQMFDPLRLCDKIFAKLDRAFKKNLESFTDHQASLPD